MHDELTKENVKFSTNPTVNAYVEGLARKLIVPANAERQLSWNWYVIEDNKTINAFATPGGNIYVYTGLLLTADNEAQIAGVLGHEIGHVVARHGARQLVKQNGIEAVEGLALGKSPNQIATIAANLLNQGAMLAYSRADENEADEYGARYSAATNYDPHGISTFFEKLKAVQGDTSKLMVWLSSHPALTDRITHVNSFITQNNLRGGDLGADRLRAVQAAIPH